MHLLDQWVRIPELIMASACSSDAYHIIILAMQYYSMNRMHPRDDDLLQFGVERLTALA